MHSILNQRITAEISGLTMHLQEAIRPAGKTSASPLPNKASTSNRALAVSRPWLARSMAAIFWWQCGVCSRCTACTLADLACLASQRSKHKSQLPSQQLRCSFILHHDVVSMFSHDMAVLARLASSSVRALCQLSDLSIIS